MDLLRHLRFFVAIADEEHFGRAARRLGMSQPPLSQGLRRLEDELGVRLFERSSRGVAVTPAGELLLPRARELLAGAEQLGELARRQQVAGAPFRVGIIEGVRPALVAAVAAAARPGAVQVVVEPTTTLVDRVAGGRLDVAVIRHPAVLAGVAAGPVVRVPTRAVLPADHPAARGGGPVRLAALSGLPMAGPPRADHPAAHDLLVDTCTRHGLDVRLVTAVDDRAVLVLAATGQAFGFTADPDLHGPGVAVLPVEADPVPLRLRVVWNPDRPQVDGARARIEAALHDGSR